MITARAPASCAHSHLLHEGHVPSNYQGNSAQDVLRVPNFCAPVVRHSIYEGPIYGKLGRVVVAVPRWNKRAFDPWVWAIFAKYNSSVRHRHFKPHGTAPLVVTKTLGKLAWHLALRFYPFLFLLVFAVLNNSPPLVVSSFRSFPYSTTGSHTSL